MEEGAGAAGADAAGGGPGAGEAAAGGEPEPAAACRGGDEPEEGRERREVGTLAVWSVTSAKPGNGVDLLRDGSAETYWQSDGTQPHLVNVQFQRKVQLREVALHLSYKNDESYTPQRLSVRVGNGFHDLREVKAVEMEEPEGWVVVPLGSEPGGGALGTYVLQIAVLSNHQNGRDSHIRQVKVYGPTRDPLGNLGHPLDFQSLAFRTKSSVR